MKKRTSRLCLALVYFGLMVAGAGCRLFPQDAGNLDAFVRSVRERQLPLKLFSPADDILVAYVKSNPGQLYYAAAALMGWPEAGTEALRLAARFLDATAAEDKQPWRERAALELMDEDPDQSAERLLAYLHRVPGQTKLRVRLMEHFRDQENFQQVLDLWNGAEDLAGIPAAAAAALEAAARLESPLLGKIAMSWAMHLRAGAELFGAFNALDGGVQEMVFGSISEPVRMALMAKVALSGGQARTAAALFEQMALSQPGLIVSTEALVRDAAAAWQKQGDLSKGAKLLDGLVSAAPNRALKAVCLESAARLYRYAGAHADSYTRFVKAAQAYDGNQEMVLRMGWFMLSALMKISTAEAVEGLPEILPWLGDGVEMQDLFEALGSSLLAKRDWDGIAKVYVTTVGKLGSRVTARFGYFLAMAAQAGLTTTPAGMPAPREMLQTIARDADAPMYYRILAAAVTDGEHAPFAAMALPEEAGHRGEENDSVRMVDGYFRFGLVTRGISEARKAAAQLDAPTLVTAARACIEEERYFDALRLMYQAARRPGFIPNRRDLRLDYPLAFNKHIVKLSVEHLLPPMVFIALIREESHFDPEIRSAAGALGLAQLMPATAKETAARLRMENPVLTNPEDNLKLGAAYWAWLRERFAKGFEGLAAYNAGYGRIREWAKKTADLPDPLALEAYELEEPRNYIRKILVSAAWYSWLYAKDGPPPIVEWIFPGLEQLFKGEER